MALWRNKTRIDNPLLCAEDGPVYQVRRWYEQFYRDVADIAPDMVARYEFEIDTTRAVAGWEAEVAANLARSMSSWGGWARRRGRPRQQGRPPGPTQLMLADERRGAVARVECMRCGAAVLAVKFSPQHTSVAAKLSFPPTQ